MHTYYVRALVTVCAPRFCNGRLHPLNQALCVRDSSWNTAHHAQPSRRAKDITKLLLLAQHFSEGLCLWPLNEEGFTKSPHPLAVLGLRQVRLAVLKCFDFPRLGELEAFFRARVGLD